MISGWVVFEDGDIKIDTIRLSKDELKFVEAFLNELSLREAIDKSRIEILLDDFSSKYKIILKAHQREKILKTIDKFYFGLGYLEDLMNLDSVEEIAVIGLNKPIYVYKEGWRSTNIGISNRDYFIDIVNKLSYKSNRRITLKNPRLNASLENYRLHATIEPISESELTIRMFRKSRLSYKNFIDKKVYPVELLSYLAMFMFTDSNIVVAGNTGSGKTSFLNVLLSFIPYKDRILIIEETPEIDIDHPHKVRLVENLELGVTLRDLVYDSLRMRSDRSVIGEIRKPEEVLAFIDIMLSGQSRGNYTTMHAHSCKELINRLITYGVSKNDIESIDLVIIQRRILNDDLTEIRRATEVVYVPENTLLYINGKLDHQSFIRILADRMFKDEDYVRTRYGLIKDHLMTSNGDAKELFYKYQKEIYGYNI